MPQVKAIHWNPDVKMGPRGWASRCGRLLRNVDWRTDKADVTCNNCLRLIAKDKR